MRWSPIATSTPFAAREHGDRLLVRVPAGEEETAEEVLCVGAGEPRHRLDALEHRAARVELHLLLREVADLDTMSDADAVPAHQLLQQRRLAGAVRADESHVLRTLERERDLT